MTIGSADVLGASEARKLAKAALASVTMGGDPQAERRGKRDEARYTLIALIGDFLAAREGKSGRERSSRFDAISYRRPISAPSIPFQRRRSTAA